MSKETIYETFLFIGLNKLIYFCKSKLNFKTIHEKK